MQFSTNLAVCKSLTCTHRFRSSVPMTVLRRVMVVLMVMSVLAASLGLNSEVEDGKGYT